MALHLLGHPSAMEPRPLPLLSTWEHVSARVHEGPDNDLHPHVDGRNLRGTQKHIQPHMSTLGPYTELYVLVYLGPPL